MNLDPGQPRQLPASATSPPRTLRVWLGDGEDVIVAVHGLAGHAHWLGALSHALSDDGITVLAADRAGAGHDRRPRGDSPGVPIWLNEIDETLAYAAQLRPNARIHLLGQCWGAKHALAAVQTRLPPIQSLLLVTPALFLRQDLMPGLSTVAAAAHGDGFITLPISDAMLSQDARVRAFLAQDSARLRQVTAQLLLDDTRLTRLLKRAPHPPRMPLWVALASHDQVLDKARTSHWLTSLEGNQQADFTGGHLLVLEQPQALARHIVDWLRTLE